MKPGIWQEPSPVADPEIRPTVFLDRDGVIVHDSHYLADSADVRFIEGSVQALSDLAAAGWRLICLTNQSGIGRGLYSLDQFASVQRHIDHCLATAGVVLDALYYCPHHPDADCGCRKPGLGMLEAAAHIAAWDPRRCWLVGDKSSDLELAAAADLQPILVRTGHGAEVRRSRQPSGTLVVADLAEAAALILAGGLA